MSLFITSTSQPLRHGVYAVERTPPATIQATGTGTTVIVEQFPWGPPQKLYTPADMTDFIRTYAPPGMSHTGSGYLSVTQKGWPILKVIRVCGSDAVAATYTLKHTTTSLLTLTLRYPGAAGNQVTATVAAATDGNANHFNLTVSVTSATGTTTDSFQNLNYSGTGSDSTPSMTGCYLLGSITKVAAGVPDNGTFSFTTGTDGTITSATYVGTQGNADLGVALAEGDLTIDGVTCGDPGSSMRAAVDTGLEAHADYMGDRVAYINGDLGLTLAAVQTAKSTYASLRTVWVDVWPAVNDDVDGTKRWVPPAPWAASVAAQLPPSTSIAWKSTIVRSLMSRVVDLEVDRGNGCITNTAAGICTFTREITGGFTFEAAVVTGAPANPTKANLTRTRMGHFIARSAVQSLREYVDSPNVQEVQQDEINAVESFLSKLKANAGTNPAMLPYIVDYSFGDLGAFNAQSDIDAGNFTIPANVKVGSSQSNIFLSFQYGETVNVTATL